MLYLLYGLFHLVQINFLEPDQYGFYALLISFNTWIFMVSDALALQGLIQFGYREENRKKVNAISLIIHFALTMSVSLSIFLLKAPFSEFFHEPKLINIATILPFLTLLTIPKTYAVKMLYRNHQLKYIFWVNFVFFMSMIAVTLYLILKYDHLNFEYMAMIYLIGTTLGSSAGIYIIRKELKFNFKGDINFNKYLKFSIPFTLSSTLFSVPKMLDVFLIQKFFSAAHVGVYQSAKTLFRVFDVSGDAAYGLIYPSAVKQIENNNKEGLLALITKSVSFMFAAFLFAVIVLELGLSEILITHLLPDKYNAAVGYFNLLLLAGLAIPFMTMSLVIYAEAKPTLVLVISIISVVFFGIAFYIVGQLQLENLIPLGLIIFNIIYGFLCFGYVIKKYKFPLKMIFRAFWDTTNFLKNKFGKSN